MSFAIDANILLYASDEANELCGQARELLQKWIAGKEVFYLAWPTVMAYLRIATHPGVFVNPLSHSEAAANIEIMLACPHLRMLGEKDGFWQVYQEAAADVPVRGNLVPDAHLAAILRQHGVDRIYTRDRDFRKFSWLKAVDPFA